MRAVDLFAASRTVELPSPDATGTLGAGLASAVQAANPGALLLYGDLGAGKTTLTRALAERLEGGKQAEISSPSFTICNIYCTAPVVHHFDLYRLNEGMIPEELEDSLEHTDVFTVVEWAERLRLKDMPQDGILCRLRVLMPDGPHMADFAALGPLARFCLQKALACLCF